MPVFLACLCIASVAPFGYWFQQQLDSPAQGAQGGLFLVHSGQSLSSIAASLASGNYIERAWPLVVYARIRGLSRRVQAGEYNFNGATPRQILADLIAGRVYQRSFTIVEGWQFRDLSAALSVAEGIDGSILDLREDRLLEALEMDTGTLEGWFFPDTYNYVRGMTAASLLRRAHERMRVVLYEGWRRRAPDLPLESPEQALSLASIVEKESGRQPDRVLIAAVFLNRLRRNMALQSDPTVIFGLGEAFNGNLKRVHLRRPGPYNTYLNQGLPPTPIALPGAGALQAVLESSPSDMLYFVSKGDGGTHFSRTLEEHRMAVRRYQIELGNAQ